MSPIFILLLGLILSAIALLNTFLIMSNQSDITAQLNSLTAQVSKIGTETSATLQKVVDLQAIIDSGSDVSPEVQAAIDALKVQVQKTDDLVPDAPAASPSA